MENCPGILNFFPRKEKSKDSTTGQPEEVEDGEGESSSAMPAIGRKECPEELKATIADLEKKLRSKAPDLTGQNATRHQTVFIVRKPDKRRTHGRAWPFKSPDASFEGVGLLSDL
jgi:hypothetical protein